jgi:hypothetical protein
MKNKVIGVYEIISGLGGIILISLSFDISTSLKMYFSIGSLLLFGLVFISGLFLFNGHKKGILFSVVIQVLQIINFNIFGVKYIFCSGSRLNINFYDLEIDFALIGEELIVGLNSPNPFLTINIIPIIVLVLLLGKFK